MNASTSARTVALLGLVVFALAVGVYANSVRNGFALDDEWIIAGNERVHGIERLPEAVTSPYWPSSAARMALYRPVAVATYALDWELWDGAPWGFHAVNVILHGAATVLVLLLLLHVGFSPGAGVVGAVVFAAHPVHTEAVANVVGRAEVLSTTFFLVACLLFLRRELHAPVRVAGIALCYFLSLGSKEIGITLPIILLLLEGLRSSDSDGFLRRVWNERAVFAACAGAVIVYLGIRRAVLGDIHGGDVAPMLVDADAITRIANAIRIWPEYVRLLFYPRHLVADYSPGVIMPVDGFESLVVLGLVVGIAILLLGAVAWRRWQISLPIFWFAITILPVSNLIFPVGILLAERTLYLPSVAIAVLAAGLAQAVTHRPGQLRTAGIVAFAAVVVAFSIRTWTRNPVWKSTETVIADLAASHPESFRVQWVLAGNLMREGRVDEAFAHYAVAAELNPSHYNLLMEYAAALVVHGRAVEGEQVLRQVAVLMPDYVEPFVYLSQALYNQGRMQDALETSTRAIEHFLGRKDFVGNIGGLYHQQAQALAALGDWDAAFVARTESIRRARPHVHWTQWRHLAEIELNRNRFEEAAAALDSARTVAPPQVWPRLTLDAIRSTAN